MKKAMNINNTRYFSEIIHFLIERAAELNYIFTGFQRSLFENLIINNFIPQNIYNFK